jgi:regulatory protein YycH of two-component signal transduction system YycFG
MNWLKWIKQFKKGFTYLKENKEMIKSGLLSLLIVLSLILTWSLWTFKPNLTVLENTRVVKKQQVEDPLQLDEVVRPLQIVLHRGDELYGISAHPILDTIQKKLNEGKFYFDSNAIKSKDFDPESFPGNDVIKNNEYIEIIYPASMPQEVYKEVFPLDVDANANKPQGIDRIFLYQNTATGSSGSEGYLVSYQNMKKQKIKIGNLQFGSLLEEIEDTKGTIGGLAPFVKYDIKERNEEGANVVERRFYFPQKEIELNRYAYISRATTEDTYDKYRKALFNDPLSVKSATTDNKEITYTDGTAAMVINEVENRFKYTNFADPGSRYTPQNISPLFQSIDYINTHAGWGNPYILSDLTRYNASFWLYVMNLPVLDKDMGMDLTWYESELYQYERSMVHLQLEGKPTLRETVTLKSGEQVIQELIDADYNVNNIKDIRIGYTMRRQSEPHIYMLEPRWFINYESKGWQPLFKESREEGY